MSRFTEVIEAHVPDVAWLIALWLAIHGGDPAPEGGVEVAVSEELVAQGALFLASLSEATKTTRLEGGALRDGLRRLGLTPHDGREVCRGNVICIVGGGFAPGDPVIGGSGDKVCFCSQRFPPSD